MIYILTPKDFNQKLADIEAVPMIRELKKRLAYPFSPDEIEAHIGVHFLTDDEHLKMKSAFEKIAPLRNLLCGCAGEDSQFVKINLKRAVDVLTRVEPHLAGTMQYALRLREHKCLISNSFAGVLNTITSTKDPAVLAGCNQHLNSIFSCVLRCTDMRYETAGIVDEGEVSSISSLYEGINSGSLFPVSLEDEIKKTGFSEKRSAIPKDQLELNNSILAEIDAIRAGVKTAYIHNIRMMSVAMVLYASLKMVMDSRR